MIDPEQAVAASLWSRRRPLIEAAFGAEILAGADPELWCGWPERSARTAAATPNAAWCAPHRALSGFALMDVTMPDGTVIQNVPDGVTKAQLATKYAMHLGNNQAPSGFMGGVRAVARGVPVVGPFLDEADAATNTALDAVVPQSIKNILGLKALSGSTLGQRYDDALNQQRGMDSQFDSAHPVLSPALQVGGAVAGTLAGLKRMPAIARPALGMIGDGTLPPLALPRLAAAGGSGLGLGAVTGFGDGTGGFENRADGAGLGAVGGGVVGLALPTLGRTVGKIGAAILDPAEAGPTTKALRDQADALFEQAKASGLQISGTSFQDAMKTIADNAQEAGIDPTLHPGATAVLGRLTAAGGDNPVSFNQAATLRRVVSSAGGSNSADERRIVRSIRDGFDSYMASLTPADLDTSARDAARADLISATGQKGQIAKQIANIETNNPGALISKGAAGADTRARYMDLHTQLQGADADRENALNQFQTEQAALDQDPQDTINLLSQARDLWSRQAKAGTIEGLMQRAQNRAGQYPLLRLGDSLRTEFRNLAQNPSRMRQFSPDEQDAIRQVAQGGGVQNVIHLLGKLAPTSIVGGGAGLTLGNWIGGPVGAAGVSSLGLVAKLASRQMTIADANAAADLMRRGAPLAVSPLVTKIATPTQGILGGVIPTTVTGGILARAQ